MKPASRIKITGAFKHNLQNVSLEIPRDALIVFTGVSGSGKTSLAFDTIFAEGQRRYFETLSTYTRQFVAGMERADVDYIEGLSPSISVDQKGMPHNPRSTVGTITEIYDYLRLLYTAAGRPHCPECGVEIQATTPDRMTTYLLESFAGQRAVLLAPVVTGRKGIYKDLIEKIARRYTRVRVDGVIYDVDDDIPLPRYKTHDIDIVVDRLEITLEARARLEASLRQCTEESGGVVLVRPEFTDRDITLSSRRACPQCGKGLPKFSPPMFAFNSPQGACETCHGIGAVDDFDPERIIPDPGISFLDGGIAPLSGNFDGYEHRLVKAALEEIGFSPEKPLGKMTEKQNNQLLFGTGTKKYQVRYKGSQGKWKFATGAFRGVSRQLRDRMESTVSVAVRERLESYCSERKCPACGGARLRPESLAVRIGGRGIHDIATFPIDAGISFLKSLELTATERAIGGGLLDEVLKRLAFLEEVGLGYLTLDRRADTLSGGEYQRVRLAAQIGAFLSGVTYVLDEPSVGLHPRDCNRLLDTLCRLRDLGNTVIVIEHDELTMKRADHIVDLGPRAGTLGGRIVAQGTMSEIKAAPESLTGQYLSGVKQVPVPHERRAPNGNFLTLRGARGNNLKNIGLTLPLGAFVCVTGVSGSGKSSLILDTLHPAALAALGLKHDPPLPFGALEGIEHIGRVLVVDASPIGKTSRSTPATYTGVFDDIRRLFASLPESRARGYTNGRFSFNVRGGRCEACEGHGDLRVEMHFLPDVRVPCAVCDGRRYNRETLEVTFKGKNIADVLDMTADDAAGIFTNIPKVRNTLEVFLDIGLGYLRLGQPGPSLSCGEAQRIKLASELKTASRVKTLYLLDEPTTGLHFSDITKLLNVIHSLVDRGHTVLVIEHNIEVIRAADWVIDLGPEGGAKGGEITAQGTPEAIAVSKKSHTGRFLKQALARKGKGKKK